MTYIDFKRHLGKAGLSIDDFASLLGVRPNSISNYAKKGVVPVQHAVIAVLLGDAVDRGINALQLLARYGVYPVSLRTLTRMDEFRKRKIVRKQ
jgi:transcriptional regulator with XRE-family HTH domain